MAWTHKAYTCAEMVNPEICAPKELLNLFEDPNVQLSNEHEALLCLLHVLMIEREFVPCTPQNLWHKTHHYSISYTHLTTGNLVSQLKYLPLENNTAIVFAIVGTKEVAKERVDPTTYVKNHTKKNPYEVYQNVQVINRIFKENVVQNILFNAQENANVNPTFGFYVLATEMKLEVLFRMDVEALVALSSTNHEFYDFVNDPSTGIWQHILYRDFPKYRNQSEGDWKALYQMEHTAKKKAEKLEKERLKREREEQEKFNRLKGYRSGLEDPGRYGLFRSDFGLPERQFGMPQEPSRRRDLASVNFFRF